MCDQKTEAAPKGTNEKDAERLFFRYAPFIRDFIYQNQWASLRGVQLAAADVLFDTDCNLLLTSSTASGKTEAVFFPILSDLCENPASSIGVLYIAPLKSLINDQFYRMEELLEQSGLSVTHWHGDVSGTHKSKLMQNPSGILQITPESLESMLMNRSNDIVRLFGDLRYVIIDEIHSLIGSDRGSQILCQLSRIDHLIGRHPRRIGLSATIGDLFTAKEWLGAGSGRETIAPVVSEEKGRWRLAMEHFYIQNDADNQTQQAIEHPDREEEQTYAALDAGYEFIYDCVRDRKSLIFSNSREETEFVTATMRQIARHRGDPDVFLIHHGNLSASIREEAEQKMKEDDRQTVTCATVTLELGIDIGRLERVLQVGSPFSVTGFLQRLGRSGRRGAPPEMMLVCREENPTPDTPLPQLIPWEMIRGIAIIQLYLEEHFIEPPTVKKMPFSLLFHQTLSVLSASGELTPKALAERVLSFPPFENVPREEYRELLLSMLRENYLEMTEEKTLLVGLKGEKLIGSFRFYAVFRDQDANYSVRCGSDEIGTITAPPPVGDRFALAGNVWEVEELDLPRRLIYVKQVQGKMEVSWPGDYGEVHTKILQKMRDVLCGTEEYPYLKRNARERLAAARKVARNARLDTRSVVSLGGMTWCMFPWLGTRSFRTLRKFLAKEAKEFGITNLEYEGCCYLTFRMDDRFSDYELISGLCSKLKNQGIDKGSLVGMTELPLFEKYDALIPGELLRKAYAADRLRTDELEWRLPQILSEYQTQTEEVSD
ncbi:MAG: DEAD/DEAH box helicase [Clostridia bacterium]|nr:DEAD/DEAH box helicase [Clostridia bacterium]